LKKTFTLFPKYLQTLPNLLFVLLQRKSYPEAIGLCKSVPASAYQRLTLSFIYSFSGDTVAARIELQKTLQQYPRPSPYALAIAYVGLNQFDQAMATLEQAYELRDINMYFVNSDPVFDPIRSDARFKALMRKMNFE
jgi:tetratricopeptide (TPR) repeat protein